MTVRPTDQKAIEVNVPLLTGGLALLAVGGVLCMFGGLAATVAVVGAARGWVRQWDEPPSAKARRTYQQARAAAAAGVQGWQQDGHQSVDIASRPAES